MLRTAYWRMKQERLNLLPFLEKEVAKAPAQKNGNDMLTSSCQNLLSSNDQPFFRKFEEILNLFYEYSHYGIFFAMRIRNFFRKNVAKF